MAGVYSFVCCDAGMAVPGLSRIHVLIINHNLLGTSEVMALINAYILNSNKAQFILTFNNTQRMQRQDRVCVSVNKLKPLETSKLKLLTTTHLTLSYTHDCMYIDEAEFVYQLSNISLLNQVNLRP